MSRTLAAMVVCALVAASCSDGDPVFVESTDADAGSSSVAIVEATPFDSVVELVLNLPGDEVFVLLDGLSDEDYFGLLDDAGVEGDAEFVEGLDLVRATALVDLLDEATFDRLLALVQSGLDPNASAVEETPEPGAGTISSAAADVRRVDAGALGLKGRVLIDVGPDDLSFLAFARTADSEAQVFVTGVTSPSGVDIGDAVGLEYGELSNFGEAAFYAPLVEEVPLEVGVYEVAFEATADIVDSGAFVRSGSGEGMQALDVVFWMATTEEYDRAALEQRFREVGEQVMGPHGISVGTMTFIDPPAEIVEQFSVLDFTEVGDPDLRALCRAMSTSVGPLRALNFAIVDQLTGGGPDAVIEGSASGLPGTALLSDSGLSCVAGMASPDPGGSGRDLFERAIVVWHEAGHHLGLYHTTEEDGLFFDLISDTPECPQAERDENGDGFIDLFECDGLDADNFMFYDGDGTVMSPGQAWTVRLHPLLYPIDG